MFFSLSCSLLSRFLFHKIYFFFTSSTTKLLLLLCHEVAFAAPRKLHLLLRNRLLLLLYWLLLILYNDLLFLLCNNLLLLLRRGILLLHRRRMLMLLRRRLASVFATDLVLLLRHESAYNCKSFYVFSLSCSLLFRFPFHKPFSFCFQPRPQRCFSSSP